MRAHFWTGNDQTGRKMRKGLKLWCGFGLRCPRNLGYGAFMMGLPIFLKEKVDNIYKTTNFYLIAKAVMRNCVGAGQAELVCPFFTKRSFQYATSASALRPACMLRCVRRCPYYTCLHYVMI